MESMGPMHYQLDETIGASAPQAPQMTPTQQENEKHIQEYYLASPQEEQNQNEQHYHGYQNGAEELDQAIVGGPLDALLHVYIFSPNFINLKLIIFLI